MGPTNVALVKLFRADADLREAQTRLDEAGKNVRLQERRQQRPEKVFFNKHVVVEKHDNVGSDMLHAKIIPDRKTVIAIQSHDSNRRKFFS